MIFLLSSLAFAQPEYIKMKKGDVAQFDGRLLNEEALATMIAKCEFNVDQCEIQSDLECSLKIADKQYEYDVLNAKFKSLQTKHDDLMDGLYYADYYAKPPLSGKVDKKEVDTRANKSNKGKKYNWFTGARVS